MEQITSTVTLSFGPAGPDWEGAQERVANLKPADMAPLDLCLDGITVDGVLVGRLLDAAEPDSAGHAEALPLVQKLFTEDLRRLREHIEDGPEGEQVILESTYFPGGNEPDDLFHAVARLEIPAVTDAAGIELDWN